MNRKLHQFKELNKIIKNLNSEFINITKNLKIEGWSIATGSSSQMDFLKCYILKDSFDSLERLDTIWTEETLLSSCDIKSYTNTNHDVFYKDIGYWIWKLINEIPLLREFTKAFILEKPSIILEFNYNNLYQQLFLPSNQRNCYRNHFCCCCK